MALLSFRGTQDAGIRYRLVGASQSQWEETRDLEVHYEHLVAGELPVPGGGSRLRRAI